MLRLLARQNDAARAASPSTRTRSWRRSRASARTSAGAIENTSAVAAATAERRADLEVDIERLPRFLRELRPTMTRLGALADEMTPVLSDLGDAAPDINRFVIELGPFAQAGIPALDSLGEAGEDRHARGHERAAGDHATCARSPARRGPSAATLADVLDVVPAQRRHRARDGLPLLPGRRRQRLRLVRPLPARGPDRQPVLDLRGRPGGGLLGELPRGRRDDRGVAAMPRDRGWPGRAHAARLAAGEASGGGRHAAAPARAPPAAAPTGGAPAPADADAGMPLLDYLLREATR